MILLHQTASLVFATEDSDHLIEDIARTCYQSEAKKTGLSKDATEFVCRLIKREHMAMIEFGYAIIRIITDRGVTHEMVRHRLASYAQESTRFCMYDDHVKFIIPVWLKDWYRESQYRITKPITFREPTDVSNWMLAMLQAEATYHHLLKIEQWTPQQARAVLPNSLKTEIVMGANFREWCHFLDLRLSAHAHPQMRDVAEKIAKILSLVNSTIFGRYINEAD